VQVTICDRCDCIIRDDKDVTTIEVTMNYIDPDRLEVCKDCAEVIRKAMQKVPQVVQHGN